MKYKVNFQSRAKEDLFQIFEYIHSALHESQTALNTYHYLQKEINTLAGFPKRFPIMDEEPFKSKGIRFMLMKKYIAFYIVEDDTGIVQILRITHSRFNWKNML